MIWCRILSTKKIMRGRGLLFLLILYNQYTEDRPSHVLTFPCPVNPSRKYFALLLVAIISLLMMNNKRCIQWQIQKIQMAGDYFQKMNTKVFKIVFFKCYGDKKLIDLIVKIRSFRWGVKSQWKPQLKYLYFFECINSSK